MPRLCCFITFLILTGCAGTGFRAPDYVPGPDETNTGTSFARSGEAGSGRAEIGVLLEQAEIGLGNLLRIAELNNPEVRAAWNEVGAAAGRAWQAELYPNPSLELEAEDIPAGDLGLGRSENKIAVVQPLVLGARRSAAISAATAERDARDLLVQHKLREVQSDVRRLYAELIYLKQAIALHAELRDTAQQTLQIATIRVNAQAAPESEMIKSQIDVHELELGRRRLERLLASSSERLGSLLGGVRVPVESIGGQLPIGLPELETDRLQIAVRKGHPAVLAARKDIEAADRRIDQAKAERVPDIDFRLAYGRNAATDEDLVEVGVSIPLPVFNRNQGRILESRHLAAKARREAESLTNALLSELATSHASYMTARDEVKTFQSQIVPGAEKASSQAKEGYRAGRTGLLDLLDAQRTLTRARLSLLESSKDLHVARADLWKIVGMEIDK